VVLGLGIGLFIELINPTLPPPATIDAMDAALVSHGFKTFRCPNILYVVAQDDQRTFLELNGLPRSPETKPRWKGVVCMDQVSAWKVIDNEGVRMGPWLLYGDDHMIHQIQAAVTSSPSR
jgi:hypothetical protein